MMRIFFCYLMLFFMLNHQASATLYDELSTLEQEAVLKAMNSYGLKPELAPKDKRIGRIYIYTQAPFSGRSGFLSWFDKLHIDTKESIIRGYLFFAEGEYYAPESIKDSELYLRRLDLVRSLAVIVPVTRPDEAHDEVDILVVTRDILSLRPNLNFSANGTIITDISIGFGEYNLLGFNKAISGSYEYRQPMHLMSLRYYDPSFLGTRQEFLIKPSLVLARNTMKYDGFLGEIEFRKALLSRLDTWGYGIDAQFGSKPIIDFSGDHIRTYTPPELPAATPIERRYRWRYAQGKAQVRRSFGFTHKKEVYLGYGLNIKKPSIPRDLKLTALEAESFKNHVLPRNETESYLFLGAAYFEDNYMTLYDYNNFELQETKRIGPIFNIVNDFSSRALLLSDHNFLRPEIKASYMQPLFKQSFLQFNLFNSNRFDGSWSDNTIKGGMTLVSPILPKLGRLVIDTSIAMAFNNRDNLKYVLGADTGLRGVTSRFYLGSKAFRANAEFRSLPFEFWVLHLGGVLFYDVGSAFEEWRTANATHVVGFGLRILAPQISSQLFRIDLGFPIYGRGRHHEVVVPSFGIGQAF